MLVLLGCEEPSTLTVDLRTDLVGGVEFTAVRTDVFAGPVTGSRLGGAERPAFAAGRRWFDGERVAELSSLSGGDYSVRVQLLRADGTTLAERTVRLAAPRSYALTVVITRTCADVVCPGPSDAAEASSCFGGRCVDPRCGADPSACPVAACESPTGCPAARVPCVRAACLEGACLLEPTGACAAGEYCDVEVGCRTLGLDAGAACDVGDVCAIGRIDCLDGEPVCVVDRAAPGDTVCRPAIGPCDVAETCAGETTCPPDELAPASTECRAARGECDAAESCTGASAECPADRPRADGAVCGAGVCIAGACVACTPGLSCERGPCERGTIDCSTATPTCAGSTPAPAGTPCRAAAGPCDVAEQCDGTSTSCPMDRFLGASTTCRPASGGCDVAEVCPGNAAACPTDRFAAPGTECRAAAGPCDVAELCAGGSACPGDLVRAGGSECRAAAGPCDVAEVCDGLATTCPADQRRPMGFECRPVSGACDVAEVCNGSATSCPTDGFVAAGTECRPAGDACNPAEACTGSSASCPADATRPNGTACGMESCGPFGACTGMGCDLTMGTRSATCTTPACTGGACTGATMRTEMQSCTRSATCPDACCNGSELGDTCSADCGPVPVGITAGSASYTPQVGNGSGVAFEDVCPDDMAIFWLTLDQVGSQFFEGLVTQCWTVGFAPDRSTSEPRYRVERRIPIHTFPERGGDGWGTWECPTGQLLTGFSGSQMTYMGRTVIDTLTLHCSVITANGRTMPGVTLTLTPGDSVLADGPPPPVMEPATPFGPHHCPAGSVARGIRGAYSTGTPDVLERFGLVCQAITPR